MILPSTDLCVVEGQPQAVVWEQCSVSLHRPNGHLGSHCETPGSERVCVTGKEGHDVERHPGVVVRTTDLQLSIIHTVSITEDDGLAGPGMLREKEQGGHHYWKQIDLHVVLK